jgi:hypothetical protein
LAIVSDAFAFADYADHTLFVIRQNYTPIELIRTLDDSYRSGKLKNVSILLNDIYRTGHGYGYGYVGKTNYWQTHIQMIRGAFKSHGYEAPRIIIWNVRAEYKDYHAQAHEEGVVMLSGWSPAILKAIMKAGVEVNTPYDGLRELLDDTRYDKVRSAFNATKRA